MKCEKCNKRIPKARLEVLPNTKFCVKCSEASKLVGITVWDQTTPELVIVNTDDAERYWQLEQIDGRLGRLK